MFVQMRKTMQDCPKVCAFILVWTIVVSRLSLWWSAFSLAFECVAVQNSYKHFCLKSWSDYMLYQLEHFKQTTDIYWYVFVNWKHGMGLIFYSKIIILDHIVY